MVISSAQPVRGFIRVWGFRRNMWTPTLVMEKYQTIDSTVYTTLRDKLNNRDSAGRGASIDGITWGSWRHSAGSFIDGTYAGTFAAGTAGGLVRTTPTTQQIRVAGTFSFSTDKQINYFELGQGYAPAAGGITQLITTRFAYDDSLKAATTHITYGNGDSFVVDWTLQVGS